MAFALTLLCLFFVVHSGGTWAQTPPLPGSEQLVYLTLSNSSSTDPTIQVAWILPADRKGREFFLAFYKTADYFVQPSL